MQLAAKLDMDTAMLSKMERGDRFFRKEDIEALLKSPIPVFLLSRKTIWANLVQKTEIRTLLRYFMKQTWLKPKGRVSVLCVL